MTDHADQFPNATRGDNSAPQAISSTVLKRIQKKAEHAVAAGIFAGTAIGCCGFVAQYGGYAGRGHHAIAIGWSLALIVGALVVFLLQRRPLKQREMAALLDAVPALSLSAQARMTAASARLDGRPISVRMAADVLDTHDVDGGRSRPPNGTTRSREEAVMLAMMLAFFGGLTALVVYALSILGSPVCHALIGGFCD
jgi:hypothetical protein